MKKLSIFADEFKNSGLWCNGNTTDSGPVFLGSNPGSPTKKGIVLLHNPFLCYSGISYSFPSLIFSLSTEIFSPSN